MAVTEEVPSQASRAEAVAVAGMGADDQPPTAIPSSNKEVDLEKAEYEGMASPSGSSGGHDVKDEKPAPPAEDQSRSKSKTLLIMLALCVSVTERSEDVSVLNAFQIAVFLAALDTVSYAEDNIMSCELTIW